MIDSAQVEGTSTPLGIIAGLGVGAGMFFYRAIVSAHLAREQSAQLIMVHADVNRVLSLANERQTQQLADYLMGLLEQLANGGAQLATIPALAPQICAEELARRSPLPLINPIESIVDEVVRRRLSRAVLFGSRVTMDTGLFGRLQGLTDVISPRPEEVNLISSVYGNIVKNERATSEEFATLRTLAHTLVERDKLDAVVLAGTDLAFVFDLQNTDFPHLDGACVHVDAVMRKLTLGADEA